MIQDNTLIPQEEKKLQVRVKKIQGRVLVDLVGSDVPPFYQPQRPGALVRLSAPFARKGGEKAAGKRNYMC